MAEIEARAGGRHGRAEGSDFAALVHRMLVRERRRPMRDVASALGLSYAAFHARVSGRVPFSPAEVALLLHEVPDMRLVDCLLRHTRFVAFERPAPARAEPGAGPLRAAARAIAELSGLVADLAIAIEGRHGAAAAAAGQAARLEEIQRAVATLAFLLPQQAEARRREATLSPVPAAAATPGLHPS